MATPPHADGADDGALITLRDGRRVRLRPWRDGDRDVYAAAVASLSPLSRHLRFLSPKPGLSPQDLDRLTDVDGVRHVAYVALDPAGTTGLAAGRYVVTEPGVAEIAFAVGDELHGTGLGRALVDALLAHGERAGVRRFTATTYADNAAARGLLRAVGFRTVARDGATVDLVRP